MEGKMQDAKTNAYVKMFYETQDPVGFGCTAIIFARANIYETCL